MSDNRSAVAPEAQSDPSALATIYIERGSSARLLAMLVQTPGSGPAIFFEEQALLPEGWRAKIDGGAIVTADELVRVLRGLGVALVAPPASFRPGGVA